MTTVNGHSTDHHHKISNLIAQLEEIKTEYGDIDVIMSKDGEGNHFSPWADYSVGRYAPDCTWAGQYASLESYEDEDPEDSWNPSEEDSVLVVCLWPVN